MPNNINVYVRYTGSRPGSARYNAPGTTKKGYAFGNNPTHRQQVMPYDQYEALKKVYPRELLLIPDDMATEEIALADRVTQCDALLVEDRDRLFNAGVITVGEAMAIGAGGLIRIFGNPTRADAVLMALLERYLGGPPQEKIAALDLSDDLTSLPRVGVATQTALNGVGIKTFKDVAENLTLEQWLSLPGKSESGFTALKEAAKQRVGGS